MYNNAHTYIFVNFATVDRGLDTFIIAYFVENVLSLIWSLELRSLSRPFI